MGSSNQTQRSRLQRLHSDPKSDHSHSQSWARPGPLNASQPPGKHTTLHRARAHAGRASRSLNRDSHTLLHLQKPIFLLVLITPLLFSSPE